MSASSQQALGAGPVVNNGTLNLTQSPATYSGLSLALSGYATSEQFVMDGGTTLNTSFLDYKIPAAQDMPESHAYEVITHEPEGPYGAKEAGEGLVSPTAPAIADAVRDAVGVRITDLPITPQKVLEGLGKIVASGFAWP